MPLAAVIKLEAAHPGVLVGGTGRDVHGFWFRHWQAVDPGMADRLHAADKVRPFTLSPLMGLPVPRRGGVEVREGTPAWIRVATLTPELSAALQETWLPRLPAEIPLGGIVWRVKGVARTPEEHPWAAERELQQLVETHLLASRAPAGWRLIFATPTTFRGEGSDLPFPMPDRLVSSWLRRWWAFGTVPLPEGLVERARWGLAVSAYRLQTVPVSDPRRLLIGCVGQLRLRAVALSLWERMAVDLLVAYAFWCGSGHYTTQGMGMTRGFPEDGPRGLSVRPTHPGQSDPLPRRSA